MALSLLYLFSDSIGSIPDTIKLTGLNGRVDIIRDEHGIPHINAMDNDDDAFFALGYMHAQDRLWQMEFQRRVVQGRLSEVFSSLTLEQDKFLRTMRFYEAAKNSLASFSPDILSKIHSYTQGINAYIAQGKLPWQFKLLHVKPDNWTDVDSIAWQKMLAWSQQFSWYEKMRNEQIVKSHGYDQINTFIPLYPEHSPIVMSDMNIHTIHSESLHRIVDNAKNTDNELSYLQANMLKINQQLHLANKDGKGSNAWVVSGIHTQSGKPILANDPHFDVASPLLWYLAELKGPQLHVTGATIPGVPAVAIGHNDVISWGVTNAGLDAQDLYIEADNTKLQSHQEIIKVRGRSDYELTVLTSKHGPVINAITAMHADRLGRHVTLRWTALENGDTTVQSFIRVNYALDWNMFKQALQSFVSPSLTFLYADTKGNIGAIVPGKIPVRQGWSGELPVDNLGNEWNGYIPFDQLPQVYNPPSGYILTANNKVVTDSYPYPLTPHWLGQPYRAQRIKDMLLQSMPLTIESSKAMQLDVTSQIWLDIKKQLLAVTPSDSLSKQALAILNAWDGRMTVDSTAATIFNYWYKQISTMFPTELQTESMWSNPLFVIRQLQTDGKYCRTNDAKNCSDFLSITLRQAMKNLTKDLSSNPDNWQWGGVHKIIFKDAILSNIKPLAWVLDREIATPGGPETVNVGIYGKENYNQTVTAGFRQIIDLSNLNNSLFSIALGQSGNITSKHYDDLLKSWRDGDYFTIHAGLTPETKSSNQMTTLMPM